jgi:hypothetical protein
MGKAHRAIKAQIVKKTIPGFKPFAVDLIVPSVMLFCVHDEA